MSKELLGIRGDVVEECDVVKACNHDGDQQNGNPNNKGKKWSKLSKTTGSAAGSAVTPDGSVVSPACQFTRRTVFVLNTSRSKMENCEIDGENDQIKARDARGRETITQAMKSMDQNQEKLDRKSVV